MKAKQKYLERNITGIGYKPTVINERNWMLRVGNNQSTTQRVLER
ncbi:hypothetical protein F3D3_0120 [Fusibacter sp. 3D3]|nr:hypothetical protein F3D3_0120 [Fusibacter sp. 3D3]